MKTSTINKLCCPFDKNDLKLTEVAKDVEGKIKEGFISCKKCKRIYPIIKGIPIMNPDEYRELKLEVPLIDKWSKQNGKTIENFRLVDTEVTAKSLKN